MAVNAQTMGFQRNILAPSSTLNGIRLKRAKKLLIVNPIVPISKRISLPANKGINARKISARTILVRGPASLN